MLIGDDFVYLHMPKTGGGTVRSVLWELLPQGYIRRGPHPHVHPGWRLIPPEAAHLPVFCHVRNPWEWYVSWYCFASGRLPRNRARLWQSAFGDDPTFATFLRRACTGQLDHDRPQLARALRGQDFYTVRWRELVGGARERLHVGRFERLLEDLEAFLVAVGAPVPDEFVARAAAMPRVHTSVHDAYREYYDAETRALVEEACRHFVRRYGYRF